MLVASRLLKTAAALLLAAATPACYRDTSNLTEEGRGKPTVAVDFPAVVEAGSVHTAELTVENPGPGGIETLIVVFNALGSPTEGIHDPLVAVGRGSRSPSVLEVRPQPQDATEGGTVYRFGGVEAGESRTISFEIKAPERAGEAANSVIVYDGTDVERAGGVRLETTVRP